MTGHCKTHWPCNIIMSQAGQPDSL